MKIILFCVIFVFVGGASAQDGKCVEKLKNVLPMAKCCKLPELVDENEIKPLVNEIEKKYETNPSMQRCMIEQEVMKKLGLAKLDKAECKNYVKKFSKNASWLSVHESSIDTCVDEVPAYAPLYQKAFNVPKDQCDAQYSFFIDCMEVTRFLKCPSDSWTKSDNKCNSTKQYVLDCMHDESFVEFLHLH